MGDNFENRRVFVGNVPYSSSQAQLWNHMEQIGRVTRVELFKDDAGYSRGCGIVEYAHHQNALRAIETLNHSYIGPRPLTVKFDDNYQSPRKRAPIDSKAQVQIRNMPQSVTWQQLKDVACQIGNVVRCDIFLDDQRISTGEGVIQFTKVQEAQRALRMLNGAIFNDRVVKAFQDGV